MGSKINTNRKHARIEWVDVAKGIAILIMILGHCLSLDNHLRAIIFSFHMPLFLILGGYFYKKAEGWMPFLKKQAKGLLIPYICTIVIQYIFVVIYKGWEVKSALLTGIVSAFAGLSYTNKLSFGIAQGTGVLWFLPLIFGVRVLFRFIDERTKGDLLLMLMISVSITFGGYWLGKSGYWLPFSADVIMYSLCFFEVGYILSKFNLIEKIYSDVSYVICLLFIWILGVHQSLAVELAVRYYPGILTCILIAISGSLVCICVCNLLCKIATVKSILKWYGSETILILCIHHLEWVFISYPAFQNISPEYGLFICKFVIITLMLFLIKMSKQLVLMLVEGTFQ